MLLIHCLKERLDSWIHLHVHVGLIHLLHGLRESLITVDISVLLGELTLSIHAARRHLISLLLLLLLIVRLGGSTTEHIVHLHAILHHLILHLLHHLLLLAHHLHFEVKIDATLLPRLITLKCWLIVHIFSLLVVHTWPKVTVARLHAHLLSITNNVAISITNLSPLNIRNWLALPINLRLLILIRLCLIAKVVEEALQRAKSAEAPIVFWSSYELLRMTLFVWCAHVRHLLVLLLLAPAVPMRCASACRLGRSSDLLRATSDLSTSRVGPLW